jgi:hypothetical protein
MPQQQIAFAAVANIMWEREVSKLIERGVLNYQFFNVADALKGVDLVFGNIKTPLTTCQESVT